MFEDETLVDYDPLNTHSPVGGLIMRPLGFVGVILAFIATLALLVIPPFQQPSYAGPSGPVEMRAGIPAQK